MKNAYYVGGSIGVLRSWRGYAWRRRRANKTILLFFFFLSFANPLIHLVLIYTTIVSSPVFPFGLGIATQQWVANMATQSPPPPTPTATDQNQGFHFFLFFLYIHSAFLIIESCSTRNVIASILQSEHFVDSTFRFLLFRSLLTRALLLLLLQIRMKIEALPLSGTTPLHTVTTTLCFGVINKMEL